MQAKKTFKFLGECNFVLRWQQLIIVFLGLFILSPAFLVAQELYLNDIRIGNRYNPTNNLLDFKGAYYYNWSIKQNRVDSRGGDIELHVVKIDNPNCKKIYSIKWTFSKDISTVALGEKIFIDVYNQPISGANCSWDWVFHNPSSINLHAGNGESSFVSEERSKEPTPGHRDYVFVHSPGTTIQAEPQFTSQNGFALHYKRLELVVGSRIDFASNATGGSFYFDLNGRDVSLDIAYVFSRQKSPGNLTSQGNLSQPVIQHNVQNTEGVYWMGITVPGMLSGYEGRQLQIVVRFMDANGKLLTGNTSDFRYVDGNGYAATGSDRMIVPANNYDHSAIQLWMPYYALNLPYTGGQQSYSVNAYAEIFVDGQMVAQSQAVPFTVTW